MSKVHVFRRGFNKVVVFVGSVLVPACGSTGREGDPAPSGDWSVPTTSSTSVSTAVREVLPMPYAAGDSFEPALQAAYIHARQLEGGPAYRATADGSELVAENEAQAIDVRFKDSMVVLTRSSKAIDSQTPWRTELSFAGVGRAGHRELPSMDHVDTSDGRIVYARSGLDEWYLNGPLGVEVGFSIAEPPAGSGPVDVAMSVSGDLVPALRTDGSAVELRDGDDHPVLRVEGLFVADATGKEVTSRFGVENGQLVMQFDDADVTYPVEVDPIVTRLDNKGTAADAAQLAAFGASVAVSDDTAAIGAPLAGSTTPAAADGPGAVYVFVRGSGGTWSQQARLAVTSLNARAQLGVSVGISGDTIIAGAPGALSGSTTVGRAFVFTRSGTTWTKQATLAPSDALSGDQFGSSVGISSGRAIVGAPGHDYSHPPVFKDQAGAAYVFTRSGTTWSQRAILTGSITVGDHFGTSVAISLLTALVGEPDSDMNGLSNTGRAYVFEGAIDGSSWPQQAMFLPPSPVAGGAFGKSVALNGITATDSGLALVAEPKATTGRGATSGTAHLFGRSGTTWTRKATLTPASAVANSQYGVVALSPEGDRAIIAPTGSGVRDLPVAVFASSGGSFTEQPVVAVPSGATGSQFGRSVALETRALVVGATSGSSSTVSGSGAAYFFTIGRKNGDACTAGLQCLSGFCTDGVCCNSACGNGSTTDCQACSTAKGGTTNGTCTALTSTAAGQTTCRSAVGACDVAEKCTSSSTTCPPNVVGGAGTVCRTSVGPCDVQEVCNGISGACPTNSFATQGTVCRAAIGSCDATEVCTGTSASCPSDQLLSSSAVCRPAIDVCDAAERCTGSSPNCPADGFLPDTVECRPAGPFCAEFCTGIAPECPLDICP